MRYRLGNCVQTNEVSPLCFFKFSVCEEIACSRRSVSGGEPARRTSGKKASGLERERALSSPDPGRSRPPLVALSLAPKNREPGKEINVNSKRITPLMSHTSELSPRTLNSYLFSPVRIPHRHPRVGRHLRDMNRLPRVHSGPAYCLHIPIHNFPQNVRDIIYCTGHVA